MTKLAGAVSRKWERRIDRARELAGRYAFAAPVLTFYSKLATFQQDLFSRLESLYRSPVFLDRYEHLPSELSTDALDALKPRFRPFLSMLMRDGPSALASYAAELERKSPDDGLQLLVRFWPRSEPDFQASAEANKPADWAATDGSVPEEVFGRFTALAFLQPYAEFLAERASLPEPIATSSVCAFCGSKPLLGVLRPEGDGAKRSLVCSFCFREWDYLRIACPACGEFRDDKMCVYVTPQFEHIRVEACETCKTYIKTIDLAKNGRAVPEVDELAAIPLTLWADEQGYTKLTRNLFGS